MITVSDVSLGFSGQNLFSEVDLLFNGGNCYGVIGANGAGKSTFLKLLSGELEPTKGNIAISDKTRMSVLKQDHYAFDEFTVLETILQGNERLYEVLKLKDELYAKEEFTEEDGNIAAELEGEFSELGGWEAETDAGKLMSGLGFDNMILYSVMSTLSEKEKVKVLLARALFGNPDIILLDEPTNGLDIQSIRWLEDFLMDYEGTVIVVSHDRHFLNNVCTHIVDVDFGKIRMYVGNYDFWYESSQLMQRLINDQKKKAEEKIKELQGFIARFSANKSKSRQATSRRKLIDKLTVEEMPASKRKYPFIGFTMQREPGKEILSIDELSKVVDGVQILSDFSIRLQKGDKVAFISDNDITPTTLFKVLAEEICPDSGEFKWGVSTSLSYFPSDSTEFFENCDLSVIKWLEQFSNDTHESYLRGFLGKMLFSGDDVYKPVKVLSGGEKVRCMFSRMMLFESNVVMLDQPTNHLDLESITAVNNALSDFKGIVLFSSHDHELISTVANKIVHFKSDGSVVQFNGNYDDYIETTIKN